MQEKTDQHLPIYVSYSTFTTFLDWLAEMPVIPSQLDRSLWSPKFSGGTGSQLMGGLRFLGLLIGEKPTDRLEPLVRADATTRKNLMHDLLREAYGVSTIDSLSSMTPKLLNDHLERLEATDATLRKAFSFLVNAAKANDIPIAPSIAKKARNKPSARKAPGTPRKPRDEGGALGIVKQNPPSGSPKSSTGNVRTIELTSGGQVTLSISVDLFDLSDSDQKFVLDLVQKLRDYQPAQQQPAEAADGKTEGAPGLQSSAAAPGAPERTGE